MARATAQYVRWIILDVRDAGASGLAQADDLQLLLGGSVVAWAGGVTVVDSIGGEPTGEEAQKLADDSAATKWVQDNYVSGVTLTFNNGAALTFDGYRYRTGNDASNRDPITWGLQVSDNGSAWTTIADETGAVSVDPGRNALTAIFNVETDFAQDQRIEFVGSFGRRGGRRARYPL